MQLPRNRLMLRASIAFAAAMLSIGCTGGSSGSGSGGGSGSGSSSGAGGESGDSGADETAAFTPDPDACEPGPTEDECTIAADCCQGIQASTALDADSAQCPSSNYPNDWSCDTVGSVKRCVNAGCQAAADCWGGGGAGLLTCAEIDGVGFCVRPCTADDQCDPFNLRLRCSGEYGDPGKPLKFCQQDPQP